MKSLYGFVALLAFVVVLCSGCSNDEDSVGPDNTSYLSAKVEGQDWNSESVTAERDADYIHISGKKGEEGLRLYLYEPMLRTGTLELESMYHSASYSAHGSNYSTWWPIQGGTCTITVLSDTEVAGTFEFYGRTLTNQVHVTEGKFRAKLNN